MSLCGQSVILGKVVPVAAFQGNVFPNAPQRVPSVPPAPESGVRPRLRGPTRRLIGRLQSLYNDGKRGKLFGTARALMDRLGEPFPGLGTVAFDDVLEASGVQWRQFWRHLDALAPTFRAQKSGNRLDVWCRELAVDQQFRWTDAELRAAADRLRREAHPFAAEVGAFYESTKASRRYLRRKNSEMHSVSPATPRVSSPEAKNSVFPYFHTPPSGREIPEEEILRPEGGSTWGRRHSSGGPWSKPSGSSLAGGGPEPEPLKGSKTNAEEDAEHAAAVAEVTVLARALRMTPPERPLPDTETRFQGGAGGQRRETLIKPVLGQLEARVQAMASEGPMVTDDAVRETFREVVGRLRPGYYLPTDPRLREADEVAFTRLSGRSYRHRTPRDFWEWLRHRLRHYAGQQRRDGHSPRGFAAVLEKAGEI